MESTNKQTSEKYCEDFLNKIDEFKWFIQRYFGSSEVRYLREIAHKKDEKTLRERLNIIWFELPDYIFNIKENPRGWMTFLNFVEE